jgi:hypothetical protein
MTKPSPSVKELRPIFTGKTKAGEEITLYQHANRPEEIHILLPNEELWALSPGAKVSTWMDPVRGEMRVDIVSTEWTGQAVGNRWDLLRTDDR